MSRVLLAIPAAVLLLANGGSCFGGVKSAGTEPVLTPIEVAVPVKTGCVPPNLAPKPDYPDTDEALKAAPDAASRYLLLYAGRKVRSARLGELESVVEGCPKAPAQ